MRAATIGKPCHGYAPDLFLSARPVRAATPGVREALAAEYVSIRATRAGRDSLDGLIDYDEFGFLSARPVRAATHDQTCPHRDACVSIRATRAGRDVDVAHRHLAVAVSIRATRAGRDGSGIRLPICGKVSIRATRAGRDIDLSSSVGSISAFLSARPVRAATLISEISFMPAICFYPRDPCGPRRGADHAARRPDRSFYPRDPCGPRLAMDSATRFEHEFLSARPVRAATPSRRP